MNEARSWVEADQHCKEIGANLVSIMDTIEQAYVFVTVEMEDTWIGLNNREVSFLEKIYSTVVGPEISKIDILI